MSFTATCLHWECTTTDSHKLWTAFKCEEPECECVSVCLYLGGRTRAKSEVAFSDTHTVLNTHILWCPSMLHEDSCLSMQTAFYWTGTHHYHKPRPRSLSSGLRSVPFKRSVPSSRTSLADRLESACFPEVHLLWCSTKLDMLTVCYMPDRLHSLTS